MTYEEQVRRTNNSPPAGIRAEGVGKRFGDLWALRDVSLEVPAGSVLGLLGHNGAGKTTFLRILTTLSAPTTGRAWVAGHDVVAAPAAVRGCIGLAGQAATVDGLLTARKNLEMIGRLYHLPAAEVRRRAGELLERVALAADADRLVKTYSGGMRRRLDLAASLIAAPPVVFLDEPTTGLDPHSRNDLWALLRERVKDGTTLVLTTQYLEEADRLADQIIVLDHGQIAARGTAGELKAKLGGERMVVTLATADEIVPAQQALRPFLDGQLATEAGDGTDSPPRVIAPVRAGTRLIEVIRALDAAGIDAHDVHRREVSLDDVFLSITGGKSTGGSTTEVAA